MSCFDDVNHCDVTISKPIINTKYKAMQILINLCLLLLSTFTPAGSASNTAGITSLNPRMPIESLLPVTSYSFHPSNTGDMRRPAIKRKRATINQENSQFRTTINLILKRLRGNYGLIFLLCNLLNCNDLAPKLINKPTSWPDASR